MEWIQKTDTPSASPESSAPPHSPSARDLLDALLTKQRLAVLSTHCEGHPHTSLVAFALSDRPDQLVFVTSRTTLKYLNLQCNSSVSLLLDNRGQSDFDFRTSAAVTITGRAEELSGAERERLLARFVDRHPSLQDFAHSSSSALFRVHVLLYRMVRGFREISEFSPEP